MAEYFSPDEVKDVPGWVAICGTLAPFTSILMFLSPIPTIRTVLRTGTVGDLPLLPYTSMVASCFVWILYGILKREPLIYVTNIVEIILSVYYFVEFSNYAPATSPTFPGSVYRHIQIILGIWFVSAWVALFFQNNVSIIGDLTVFLTILTDASPLAAIKAVLESQSSEAIPWPFTLATLLNCCLWTVVGVAEMHDVYVYFPSILGLMFALAQIALKLIFGDHESQDSPTFTRTPVDMPYPVLGSVRQVVMMGNSNNNASYNPLQGVEDHDLQLDMNSPSSNTDYVELGAPMKNGGEHRHQSEPNYRHQQPGGMTNSSGNDTPAFAQQPPFRPHTNNTSNEGMESVIFDDPPGSVPHQIPLQDSFRSRSGGSGPPTAHGHAF